MRKILSLLILWTLALTTAQAKDFVVDGAHSSASFKIKHLMSKVSGGFNQFSGQFNFDPKKVKSFKGEFVIQVSSIDTNNVDRDQHLRGEDFFHAEKYSSLVFKSKEMKPAGENKYHLSGELTMRGITKPVVFDVEYLGEGKDPWGNDKVGFAASAKVNRKDWGMVWNKTLDAGGFVLGDTVEIDIQVEGNAKK